MAFAQLHCHSHFSLLKALPQVPDLVAKAKAAGCTAAAITDRGVMYGALEFYNECRAAELKPIIGLDMWVTPEPLVQYQAMTGEQPVEQVTFLAKDYTGYLNLMQLTSQAHLHGLIHGRPHIDFEILKQYHAGTIVMFGPETLLAKQLVNLEPDEALHAWRELYAAEDIVMNLCRNALEDEATQEASNQRLLQAARTLGLPAIASSNVYYLEPSDAQPHEVLVCIGEGQTIRNNHNPEIRNHDWSFLDEAALRNRFVDLPELVDATLDIANRCNFEIPINQRYFPVVQIPEGENNETWLKKRVYELAPALYDVDGKLPEHVVQRIEYELDIICQKGFAPYFLMVADIVDGAHSLGAITNTRGSAAGSLVGRILNISNVDPLFYQLPFERFLTLHRPTPPDIDLDIADDRRDEVIAWITERYGHEKVAQIITFGTMKARAAVRDVGRALGISYGKCDRVAKLIPIGKQGFDMTIDKAIDLNPDLAVFAKQDEETRQIIDIARRLEGCARHASIHAAGVVITPTAMTDYTPLQREPDGDRLITQYDMYSLDTNAKNNAIGVIKMDLLGIRNLSILERAVTLIQARHPVQIDLLNLPHPDPKTMRLLSAGHTFGVFQLGSAGMTRYLKELQPGNIFDISAMIALYRPGPLQFIPEYIKRKHNPKLISYLDPALEQILHRTYGILVYQDDLLIIAHDLAGYTWEEVDKFRKAVGKKDPEVMAKQKEKFIQGCVATAKWSEPKATEVWAWIEPFAAYGFNKSHSASYAIVSYQTAYLKANYPVEFMTAVMSAEAGDEEKIWAAVEECKLMGISVLPPDVVESNADFTVIDEKTIRFGLNAVKNLGSDVVAHMCSLPNRQQTFTSLGAFIEHGLSRQFNKRSWEALVKSGAVDRYGERGQLLANTEHILQIAKDHHTDSKQGLLFSKSLSDNEVKLKDAPVLDEVQKLKWEKEYLGLYVSSHPLVRYANVLAHYTKINDVRHAQNDSMVQLGGIITKSRKTFTKKGDPMAFFTISDGAASVEVLVFPKVMPNVAVSIDPDTVVRVTGRVSLREGEVTVIADTVQELPNDDSYGQALTQVESGYRVMIMVQHSIGQSLATLRDTIKEHAGAAKVVLQLRDAEGNITTVNTDLNVSTNKDVLGILRKVSGVMQVEATK